MALVGVNDVQLLVEASGGGDPVVLVHGSWDDHRVWALAQQELVRDFRVISYDRRGHTGSSAGPRPARRRDDEDDLAGLIDSLDLGPAHVVGNSFGGSIVLGLASRRPELMRTLCLHEPPLLTLAEDDPMVAATGAAVGPVVDLVEQGQPEVAARAFVENVAVGPGAWETMPEEERASMVANAHTFADEQRDPAWASIDLAALGRLELPVLLTRGDQSPPFFSTIIGRLEQVIPDTTVRTLLGAGHVPHLTHPDEYAAAIREVTGR